MSAVGIVDHLRLLCDPAFILTAAASSYVKCFLGTLFRSPLSLLLHPLTTLHDIREDAFSSFWSAFTKPPPSPIPEDELEGSNSLLPKLMRQARGTVLELGPGSGSNLRWYAGNNNITNVYGAEPVVELHHAIEEQISYWDLKGKYQILHARCTDKYSLAGALDLPPQDCAVFDTVICTRVLCGVPQPATTVREIQQLLKPGGQLLVAEHIVNPVFAKDAKGNRIGSGLGRAMQTFYQLMGWSFFVGDCRLTQDTRKIIKDVGGWQDADVQEWFTAGCLPYICGVWTKAAS